MGLTPLRHFGLPSADAVVIFVWPANSSRQILLGTAHLSRTRAYSPVIMRFHKPTSGIWQTSGPNNLSAVMGADPPRSAPSPTSILGSNLVARYGDFCRFCRLGRFISDLSGKDLPFLLFHGMEEVVGSIPTRSTSYSITKPDLLRLAETLAGSPFTLRDIKSKSNVLKSG
jgi:hypothetical protein